MRHLKHSRRKFAMRSFTLVKNSTAANRHSQPDDNNLYHQLFNLTNAIKLIIDPATLRIVEANPAACTFYGYSQAQMASMSLKEINALPEPIVQTIVQDVMAGTRTTFETRHRLASGEIRAVSVQAGLLFLEGKHYLYAIVQDITDRKRIEIALRRSERLYRLFAQNMPDTSVIMFDTDMRYTLVEGPFLKRFGTTAELMVGKLPQEVLTTQEAIDYIVPIYQRALKGESFSYERQTPDYAYQAHVAPLEAEDGQIIGGMILSHDITELKRAEAALLSGEQRLQSIISTMSEGVVSQRQDGTIDSCNPAAERILGLSAAQMMGRDSLDPRWRAIHENGSPFPGETHPIVITLRTGQPINNVIMGVHKPDDTLVWISLNTRPMIRPNESQPYAAVATLIDITEQKRLQDILKASEEQLRLITDNMQDMIIRCDAQDRILYTSPSCFPLLGYRPEEMIGHFAHEFVPPDVLDKIVSALQQITQQGLTYGIIEARMRHADGHYIDIETTGRFLYDTNGSYTGGVFVARDISERKQFEAALTESEEKYRLITENTSDGIFVYDTVGKQTTYASPAYDHLLGREVGETLNIPQSSFQDAVHPEDTERVSKELQGAITNKRDNLTTTYRSQRKDGQYFWREDHTTFNYDTDGRLLIVYIVSRDITERKQMESLLADQQKLQTSLEKEHELSTLKSHMMERIAHEFRTPLTTIQVASETLIHYHDRLTPEKRDEKSVTVKNQIRRITHMLDEIGQVVRSTDARQLERQPTDLCEFCREIASKLASDLKQPGKYHLEIPDRLIVQIDQRLFEDSLTHIMRNAAHYSEPADPVTVRLSQMADHIELRVIDHGIGIAPNELPRIFDPFFRGSNINERGGLGIGLTIARATVEAHGGTIRVESELEKGTTFIITLPV